MRSYRFVFVPAAALCFACGPQVVSAGPVAAASCQPLPGTAPSSSAPEPRNSTPLAADSLESPISKARLYFAAPELSQEIPLAASRAYPVRVMCDPGGEEQASIEVALDDGRPRRFAAPFATVSLGELLAPDSELEPGIHWLFAAPVLASGLVPRPAIGLPRSAIARRFFVGKRPAAEAGPTGAVWLRKPEGTYNGAESAARVAFDVFVFSVLGTPLDTPSTITLRGPSVSGDLRIPSPFLVHDVPSGDYRVAVSASGARPLAEHFTVNRELGGAP